MEIVMVRFIIIIDFFKKLENDIKKITNGND